uniref:ABC transporter domain-containing protein n=1 Tax=Timema monikensis TaxID=170555 RepID=A0A7R9EKG3_9NEOP|nr:unnamed protein product [Timema monikensis]
MPLIKDDYSPVNGRGDHPVSVCSEGQVEDSSRSTTSEKHKSKENEVGMRYLRNVPGKTRIDRVSNGWVLKECGLKGNLIVPKNIDDVERPTAMALMINQLRAMLMKNFYHTWRTKILFFIEILIPISVMIVTFLVVRQWQGSKDLPSLNMDIKIYGSKSTPVGLLVNNSAALELYQIYKGLFTSGLVDMNQRENSFTHINMTELILSLGAKELSLIRQDYIVGSTFDVGDDGVPLLTGWFNNLPLHSPAITLGLLHNTILKWVMGDTDYSLSIINQPLPYNQDTKASFQLTANNLGFQLSFNLGFAMSFVTAFYVMFQIKERVSKSKHLQLVSGVKILIYWGTSYLWDLVTFFIVTLWILATMISFQEEGYSTFIELGSSSRFFTGVHDCTLTEVVKFLLNYPSHYNVEVSSHINTLFTRTYAFSDTRRYLQSTVRYFVVFMSFACGVLPLIYLFSYLYSSPSTGFTRVVMLNAFTGEISLWIGPSDPDVDGLKLLKGVNLGAVYLMIPCLCLGLHTMNMSLIQENLCLSGVAGFLIVCILDMPSLDLSSVSHTVDWVLMSIPLYSLGISLRNMYMNNALQDACKLLATRCNTIPNPCCRGESRQLSNYLQVAGHQILSCATCFYVLLQDPELCPNGKCIPMTDNFFDWTFPGVGRNIFFFYVNGIVFASILMFIEFRCFEKILYRTKLIGARLSNEVGISVTCVSHVQVHGTESRREYTKVILGLLFWNTCNFLICVSARCPHAHLRNYLSSYLYKSWYRSTSPLSDVRGVGSTGHGYPRLIPTRFLFSVLEEVEDEDSDVAAERKLIRMNERRTLRMNYKLLLIDVSKFYGNFQAVDQLCVGVKRGECFGLLGVNGAGKTSTFKMLTGDEKISGGEAYVNGLSLKTSMQEVHQFSGYCPQFDALIDELTGRETLTMFCLLRGIPSSKVKYTVNQLADKLTFTKHIDKSVKDYSGGNKRKLSTAVALVGDPPVVYLDEPTTGMDVVAKRHLWNVICQVRDSGKHPGLQLRKVATKNKGLPEDLLEAVTLLSMEECKVLCTRIAIMVNTRLRCFLVYSMEECEALCTRIAIMVNRGVMEECEALCTRIAIMVNGRFKCLGSPQHLKSKFAEGYTLTIKVKPREDADGRSSHDLEMAKEFVRNSFPGSLLREEHEGLMTYHVPRSTLTWSRMFGILEDAKRRLNIEDYSLGQTSLEQRPAVEKRSSLEVLYRAYFVAIVTCAAETWTVNIRETRKVEAMEMKLVRSLLAVTRRNRIRNEVIRGRGGLQGVHEIVEEARDLFDTRACACAQLGTPVSPGTGDWGGGGGCNPGFGPLPTVPVLYIVFLTFTKTQRPADS